MNGSDIRRAIVDDIDLKFIDENYLTELKSGATMDYLVGKCINAYTHVVYVNEDEEEYDDILESRHEFVELIDSTGEYFINNETGDWIRAEEWNPSANTAFSGYLIVNNKININFFDYESNTITATINYVENDVYKTVEVEADNICEAVCKVIIAKHCNLFTLEV